MKITAGLGSIDEYERFRARREPMNFSAAIVPFSWAEDMVQ